VAAVVAGAVAAGAVVVGAVAVGAEGVDADAGAGVASRNGGSGGEQEPPCESAAAGRAPSPMDTLGADAPWPMDGIDRPALLQSARFNVVRLLGQGAFGQVYLVNDQGEQLVAKVFDTNESGVRADCLREVAYLRQCVHPHILAAHGAAIHGSLVYLFMEAMEHDLGAPRHRAPPPAQRRRLARGVAYGLAHLHGMSLMHRDLKPANILVSRTGEAKIADFGMTRIWGAGRNHTLLVCTLWYRAPELLLGDARYTPAVDMWSFGLILIALAMGSACFRGTTEADQLAWVFRALGRPTSATWPGVERLDGYPRVRVNKSPVAHPRFLQDMMNDAQLCGDEAVVALGALRYNPASRLCAHEAAALLGGMPPPNEPGAPDPPPDKPGAPDPPPGVRTDKLADPGRGALADAICHATTAHSLDWGVMRVAAWVADRFVTTRNGAAYLAAAAQAQVDLLAHVVVSIAAKSGRLRRHLGVGTRAPHSGAPGAPCDRLSTPPHVTPSWDFG